MSILSTRYHEPKPGKAPRQGKEGIGNLYRLLSPVERVIHEIGVAAHQIAVEDVDQIVDNNGASIFLLICVIQRLQLTDDRRKDSRKGLWQCSSGPSWNRLTSRDQDAFRNYRQSGIHQIDSTRTPASNRWVSHSTPQSRKLYER